MHSRILLRLLPLILVMPALQAETSLLVERECKRIAVKLASVSYRECLNTQLKVSNGVSLKNAPILVRDIPASPGKQSGKVLLVGGIHGDEYATTTIVFKWLALLDDYNAGLFHWRVVPLLNPDGLLQQRSEKPNAGGRDLDRSFPTGAAGSGMQDTPETKWLVEEINSFEPDAIIVLHAPHEIVDYASLKGGNYELQRLTANQPGLQDGSLNRYAAGEGIPVLTVELPYADIMPTAGEVKMMWQDILDWVRQQAAEKQG